MTTAPTPLLVLTDRTQCDRASLIATVASCVDGGARAVVVREKDLLRTERVALVHELAPILRSVGGTLLVASDPTIEADGVHLAAADPFPTDRPPIVGRSCHDRADVDAAAAEGCDYVTLSPVFATASKPGHGPALGADGLRSACEGSAVPIVALGGIASPAAAEACFDAGADGVAVMGWAMRDDRRCIQRLRPILGLRRPPAATFTSRSPTLAASTPEEPR